MTPHDSQCRREPQPAAEKLRRKERVEDPRLRASVHAGAGVADVEPEIRSREQLDPRELRTRICWLDGHHVELDRDCARPAAEGLHGARDETEPPPPGLARGRLGPRTD